MQGPVLPGGKLQGRAAVASVSAGSLTLHDARTNRAFLIDTGAEVSVVPANDQERQGAPWKKELVAANGSRIQCFGEKEIATARRPSGLRVDLSGSGCQETTDWSGFSHQQLVVGRS